MSSAETQVRIKAPELRGSALAIGACRDREVCLDGPAGCVAGETRIYNPATGEHTPIKALCDKKIAPIVHTLMGAIQAEVPFRKGVRDLYRVTLTSGRQCVVTDNHLFLTPDGWRFASSVLPSVRLLVSAPCPHPTTEASDLLVSLQDALRLSQTPLGSQESCQTSGRSYGVQPLLTRDTDLTPAPSQDDVHVHSRVCPCEDAQDTSQEYSRPHQSYAHHARRCYFPLTDDTECTQFHDRQETSLQVDASCQYAALSQKAIRPLSPTAQSQSGEGSTRRRELLLAQYQPGPEVPLHGDVVNSVPGQLARCFVSSDTTQGCAETLLESYVYSPSMNTSNTLITSNRFDCSTQWDTVSSIKYERTDEYFDLHVPVARHYLAEGIWHHNTGKTVGALYKIHRLLCKYPESRALVARKTNTALAGSAMVTYRDNIKRNRTDIHWFGGNKVEPAAFRYSNGSQMIVNGLDKPEKVQSAEFDWAYLNEATECDLENIEFVRMRLRPRTGSSPDIPYRQLIMDCNPGPPTHWLNQRMNAGITTRFLSRHEDNPRYFDVATQDWTEDGREYIFGILGGLSGVRLARYRYGIWAAAEGTVFEDSWDRQRNVVKRFDIPAAWPRYLILDFGFTHPFVCLWAAEDPDGRLYIYREIYKTKRLVEDHAKDIKRLSRWGEKDGDPYPRFVIADHDAGDRETFTRYTGLHTVPAHKSVSDGLQAMASRLRPAGDGKPRLMYFEDMLVERDADLVSRKQPASTLEEYDSYVWDTRQGAKKGEQPVKEFDHGIDASRYLCARDLVPTGVQYYKNIWK